MATSNVSQTYDDYVKEIQTLTPEEQLSLVKVISAGLKKHSGGKRQNIVLWSSKDWERIYGKALTPRNMCSRRETRGIS
jgi:hypothetical protein